MKKSVLSVFLGVFILLFVVVSFILSQQLSLQSPNSLSNQENDLSINYELIKHLFHIL